MSISTKLLQIILVSHVQTCVETKIKSQIDKISELGLDGINLNADSAVITSRISAYCQDKNIKLLAWVSPTEIESKELYNYMERIGTAFQYVVLKLLFRLFNSNFAFIQIGVTAFTSDLPPCMENWFNSNKWLHCPLEIEVQFQVAWLSISRKL